ncbi:helix-turn-helix domain-containing protein [Salmonella enterica]|nr:helix-turn-helix domain-containing protein [Salmonella enterica]ECX8200785.1 helix-turn-helix domain-containing protein [Salmonella enterica]ELE6317850.1 helix-turn-helix domain-containing protein [Salmonella enterica]
MKKTISEFILLWIEENLENNITVGKLAVITGYSERSIHIFFKDYCGMTIGKYIRNRRLCRTAFLLKLTSRPITEIAIMYGFDSLQSYSREFKKLFSVSPREYRNSDNWDFSAVHPKYLQSHDSCPPFEKCTLETQQLNGYQSEYQLGFENHAEMLSFIKWPELLKTMRLWQHDIYCVSSFAPFKLRNNIIQVNCFTGMLQDKNDNIATSTTFKTPPGEYIKCSFSGNWEQYKRFSFDIYTKTLPKYGIIRRAGADIEHFRFSENYSQCNESAIIDFDHYIPVI